jgi:glycosyltransferase involved in cell wall biosynthesis
VILFSDGSEHSNLPPKQAATELHLPYVAITHLPSPDAGRRHSDDLPAWPALYQRAWAVVSVSRASLESLAPALSFPGVPARVIYNSVPLSFFEPRREGARHRARRTLGVPGGAVLVLTTARMEASKGYQYQIAAMRRLRAGGAWPRLQFAWAGTGTCEARLRAAAAESGVADHVRFLGERLDTVDLLDAADIFLLPSECEGMSVSVLEAMAKGLPVIASAVGGMPEALGPTGQLLPPLRPDPEPAITLLAKTLDDWATRPELREAVGRQCGERARDLFFPQRMIDDYLALIHSVMGEPRVGAGPRAGDAEGQEA